MRALAEVVKYAQWRRHAAAPGKVPQFLDETIDEHATAGLIETLLGPDPDPRGRPLTHDEARELLAGYGVPVRPALPAPDPEAAVAAAAELGYPVALKTTAPHLRHRADLGGVRLDLVNENALRRAYDELTELLGTPAELRPVVQAMVPRGSTPSSGRPSTRPPEPSSPSAWPVRPPSCWATRPTAWYPPPTATSPS